MRRRFQPRPLWGMPDLEQEEFVAGERHDLEAGVKIHKKGKTNMRLHKIIPLLVISLGGHSASGQPKIVTFVQTSTTQTNTVHIGDFESVKILTARDFANSSYLYGF